MRARAAIAAFHLLGLILAAGNAAAQVGPLGSEFQVNTNTTGSQTYPAVAAAANDTFVVVWTDPADDGNVMARRFDGDGLPQGTEFQVNSYTTSYQGRPAVAASADGAFVVTWMSYSQDGSDSGVFAQRYDGAGLAAGTEFQVNTHTTDAQGYPTVSTPGDGSFVVAWVSSQDGSDSGVVAQRFDAAGQPLGTEFQVNTYTTGGQYEPAVASGGDGSFAVTWMSNDQDGSGPGVFAQRFDSAGQPAGAELQVNSYTTSDQIAPAVAAAADGAFVIAWTGAEQDGNYSGTFARRYDSAGVALGTEFQVNTYTTGEQSYPASVAAQADGAFVVVWRSNEQDGDQDGVFGQRFDSAGLPAGSEFQINTYTTAPQWMPGVAAGPNGSFVVVWQSEEQDGDSDGVFAQRYGSAADCGDSNVDPGEECDDGDAEDGDGCDSNCTTTACGNGITTLGEECDDGNALDGDGCSVTCQDSAAPEGAADAELTAGETISSDDESDGATEADPLETSIAMSVGTAAVTIAEASDQGPAGPGYSLIGQQVQIDFDCPGSPCPSASAPLQIQFRIDASRIPSDVDETNLAVLRDGALVPECTGGPGIASPDPCVGARQLFGDGDIGVTILTSLASLWSFASTTCAPAPLLCSGSGKALLLVKRTSGDPDATKLVWKWLKGTVSGPASFGDPLTGTSYALCTYDGAALVESHVVAPGGDCGSAPCWKTLGTKGFGYKNAAGNDEGVTKVLLKSGAGKAKILVKGKGPLLAVPDSDPIYAQAQPVVVQLVASSGGCWQASYASPAKKSTGAQFKDTAP